MFRPKDQQKRRFPYIYTASKGTALTASGMEDAAEQAIVTAKVISDDASQRAAWVQDHPGNKAAKYLVALKETGEACAEYKYGRSDECGVMLEKYWNDRAFKKKSKDGGYWGGLIGSPKTAWQETAVNAWIYGRLCGPSTDTKPAASPLSITVPSTPEKPPCPSPDSSPGTPSGDLLGCINSPKGKPSTATKPEGPVTPPASDTTGSTGTDDKPVKVHAVDIPAAGQECPLTAEDCLMFRPKDQQKRRFPYIYTASKGTALTASGMEDAAEQAIVTKKVISDDPSLRAAWVHEHPGNKAERYLAALKETGEACKGYRSGTSSECGEMLEKYWNDSSFKKKAKDGGYWGGLIGSPKTAWQETAVNGWIYKKCCSA
uniref:Uncharacterized protein n=1 Tax=Chromera velia CCMP2878 TaxID=1169474 RepID=A0A0G4I0Y2_9ALVE|eukprot:Cvel_10060.t1-p1 / transcript=Cvel_10060.t1 / gene=Cvel_10060 / organism=Chromera_velia_CCMP2878 / gene_product=hypothetical protein / transcript_product=hypothetical protein / location=Cvel_scaffold598:60680-62459(-) / protein_length=373 / sequence_SO=supercontig / SO=protein_coding / is_pseudo=false